MKAYEAAKKLKMENKDFLEQYEIKSHLSKLDDELVEELFGGEKKISEAMPGPEAAVDSAEADVVTEDPAEVVTIDTAVAEVVTVDCSHSVEEIELSIRCLGNKSPLWKWRSKLG